MTFDIDIFDIDWAKKTHGGGVRAYGADVYISMYKKNGERDKIYICFRNGKLGKSVDYLQMARLGDMLLFKESDSCEGWKLTKLHNLTETKAILPSITTLPKDLAEFCLSHVHEGFDLNYDVKHDIYYIDTTKRVKG